MCEEFVPIRRWLGADGDLSGSRDDTGGMELIVVLVVVALVAAAGVLVLAGWVTGESAPATFFADLRAGLRRSGSSRADGVLASARREHADAAEAGHGSIDDLFAVGNPVQKGYLDTEGLTAGITRTVSRVVRSR